MIKDRSWVETDNESHVDYDHSIQIFVTNISPMTTFDTLISYNS